jgi:hypothetical protein
MHRSPRFPRTAIRGLTPFFLVSLSPPLPVSLSPPLPVSPSPSIYHFDAYRLGTEAEFSDLGAAEYFEGQGVCLVEWADRVASCLPTEHLQITITITGEQTRNVNFAAQGPRYEVLLKELAQSGW